MSTSVKRFKVCIAREYRSLSVTQMALEHWKENSRGVNTAVPTQYLNRQEKFTDHLQPVLWGSLSLMSYWC